MSGGTSQFAFEAGKSKYQQVADDLRRRIRDGDLPVGASLGDIFRMGEYYGCSWGTVREAQRLLVTEGLLSEIRPGLPTRVLATPLEQEPNQLLTRLLKLRRELDEIIDSLENGDVDGTGGSNSELVHRQLAALEQFDVPAESGLAREQASQVFKEYGLDPRSFGAFVSSGYLAREDDRRFLTAKGRSWIASRRQIDDQAG